MRWIKISLAIMLFLCTFSYPAIAQDGGYTVFSGIWLKAVLNTSAGDINLKWKRIGADTTVGTGSV